MELTDERRLYDDDKPAWARYVAPKWVDMLEKADDAELEELRRLAGPELKTAIWAIADEALRTRLTANRPVPARAGADRQGVPDRGRNRTL